MTADQTYELIHDELLLDGRARLNLATFVTTWMEPQAEKLMAECFSKNMIDKDEYPQTAEIENRCINMVSRLFNAPETGVGVSTIGSSEAVMLAGLSLKWEWRKRMKAQGKASDRPNMVMGSSVQVVAQYYNFLRLGRAGYTRVMQTLSTIATGLSGEIPKIGSFELVSDGSAIPVFAFKMKDDAKYTVFELSDHLRLSVGLAGAGVHHARGRRTHRRAARGRTRRLQP